MGNIAYHLHFPPNDIWEMDIEEIKFWNDRIIEQVEAMKIK